MWRECFTSSHSAVIKLVVASGLLGHSLPFPFLDLGLSRECVLTALFFMIFAVLVFAETLMLQCVHSFTWMHVGLAGSIQAYCLSFDYLGICRWSCKFDISVVLFASQICFV